MNYKEDELINIRVINKDDLLDIFQWRNDPITIKMSLSRDSVTLEEHKKWFFKLLKDNRIKMYMMERSKKAIGVIRYDQCEFSKNIYETTINIAPDFRGMGFGKILLSKTINRLFDDSSDCRYIRAKIRKKNLQSQNIFIDCGFKLIDIQGDIKVYLLER